MLKVDVFIPKDTPYAREAFGRSRSDTLHVASHRSFIMATPEDVVLNKLEWYRRGGRSLTGSGETSSECSKYRETNWI
jgi:hypothetical protein